MQGTRPDPNFRKCFKDLPEQIQARNWGRTLALLTIKVWSRGSIGLSFKQAKSKQRGYNGQQIS